MILESLDLDPAAFEARTGWAIKPEGACRGDVCVPLGGSGGAGGSGAAGAGGTLSARVLSERLGMPLLHDAEHGVWSLGPATVTGKALTTAECPDLTLPGVDGNPFSLSALRGRKVLLVAWASW